MKGIRVKCMKIEKKERKLTKGILGDITINLK